MSVNDTDLRPRGENELLAIKVAMEVFRRNTKAWLQANSNLVRQRVILADLDPNYCNSTVVTRIAASNPGLPVRLEGARQQAETQLKRMAVNIIFQIILDIVSFHPRGLGELWTFLGGDVSNRADLSRTKLSPGGLIDASEIVELWAGTYDNGILVVYQNDEELYYPGPPSDNSHVSEALRRREVLNLSVLDCKSGLDHNSLCFPRYF